MAWPLWLWRDSIPDVPVIIVSGAIGEETAIESLKAGATDYVLKQRLSRLGPVVDRALRKLGKWWREGVHRRRSGKNCSTNWSSTSARSWRPRMGSW